MPGQLRFRLILLAALTVFLGLPWLAWKEAQRQAFDATAELASGYARSVLLRAEETARQAQHAIVQLSRANGAPCSPRELALMRQLDLTSTYLQAVGRVRDGVMLCSSMNGMPFTLGGNAFRTANGVTVYPNVPLDNLAPTPLMALERDGYAALLHRDLPLDSLAAPPAFALGVFQLDRANNPGAELARGEVHRAWLAQTGKRQAATFVDGTRLVAVVRSARFRIAAVAAVPFASADERTRIVARRLVPAGTAAGLTMAIAFVLLAQRQTSLAGTIRDGLRRKEFFVLYQPVFELATKRCVGAEALLRWRRPNGELIGPDLFIPAAERSTLITALTERLVQLVQADCGKYLAAHPAFHIALNLSAADLRSQATIGLLDDFLMRSGAAGSNLILEITERCFIDGNSVRPVIDALRQRGIGIAIDDFGTGYSSLSQLESLHLDYLKIDRSFVEAIGTRAPTNQVVGHIITIARTMGLRMIAEGIELDVQADYLTAQHVQYGQGWLLGKPMPFQDVTRMVAEHERSTMH